MYFPDLVKDAKSVAGFSASCQFQVGWNDITLVYGPKWWNPKANYIYIYITSLVV